MTNTIITNKEETTAPVMVEEEEEEEEINNFHDEEEDDNDNDQDHDHNDYGMSSTTAIIIINNNSRNDNGEEEDKDKDKDDDEEDKDDKIIMIMGDGDGDDDDDDDDDVDVDGGDGDGSSSTVNIAIDIDENINTNTITNSTNSSNTNSNSSTTSSSTSSNRGTYPADCYSFLSLYGPINNIGFFSFGIIVWFFQISFLILLVLRVASKRLSTNEENANPGSNFFASFIPSNVPTLARATQIFAILSYCIFADASIKAVVTAVEVFPNLSKAKSNDKVHCMAFSCLLRFIQGMLACLVVLLLVITTDDVIDIVLNFTAVNFISGFDSVAFELAQWGKYGPALEKEAKRIEKLPLPDVIYLKNKHVRYRWTLLPIALVLLTCITIVAISQESKNIWITKVLRVQYDSDTIFDNFSGCYHMNTDISIGRNAYSVYEGDENNIFGSELKFGYCKPERKWFLFKGNGTSACDADELDKLAYSERTYDFDISVSFEGSWYSRTGTPLDMYFFDDEDSLDVDQCKSFLGDGVCNKEFNSPFFAFDEGDCCAATCYNSQCGVGTMKNAFNTDIANGDGYPTCINPSERAITIRINSVYTVEEETEIGDAEDDIFGALEPRNPLLILDCDGSNLLTVNIEPDMKNQTETLFVSDGADCNMLIKNRTSGGRDIYYVNYTIFHGDEASLDDDAIVIMDANSYEDGLVYFRRYPDCYFTKLSDYIDISTIYTASDSSNKAIDWLTEDSSGYSSCENEYFVERFALATINFAAPIDVSILNPAYNETSSEQLYLDSLWIRNQRQCAWTNVACKDGSVVELDVGSVSIGNKISGTIPTELGLLKNLTKIDMTDNSIFSTIPSEMSGWSSLDYVGLGLNYLTGAIPSEIGLMNLEWFFADQNLLSGKIPSEIGELSKLRGFFVYINPLMTGTIPTELARNTLLEYLILSGNPLMEGTIPSEFGLLKELVFLGMISNGLNGTIPSSLSELNNLTNLELNGNAFTGNVSLGIVNKTYVNFNVYGNKLSDLIPVDGLAICTRISNITGEVEGEHYCNCGSDCLAEYGQRCECEEAQACCDIYIEQNNITNCVACEGEFSFSNPELRVSDWGYASCSEAAGFVYSELDQFGTEEQCYGAKMETYKQGCVCPGFIPTEKAGASKKEEEDDDDDDSVQI